jgi:hypothetical protein
VIDEPCDEPIADPPPRLLTWFLWSGVVLTLATFGFSLRYLGEWRAERADRSILEQRLTLIGVPFFKPAFVEFVERAKQTIPEDARLLIEPRPVQTDDGRIVWDQGGSVTETTLSGQARWFLYLNYYLYPRQVYVRRPELASGTLVDYPRWLDHHFQERSAEVLDEEAAAIEAHEIDWRMSYPTTRRFQTREVELSRRTDDGWEPVELGPLPVDSVLRDRNREGEPEERGQ